MPSTPALSSPKTQYQKKTKPLLSRKTAFILASIISLLLYYKSLVEFTYKLSNTSDIPINNNKENYDDSLELEAVDLYSIKEHRYKFRVDLNELKTKYQVSDTIRIIIEPRKPSLVNKLKSSLFRVQVKGPTIFSPQLVSSPNSSVLIYEAPLLDQGTFTLQARIVFYNYPNIYSTDEIPSRMPKLDQVILNGEFKFKVEQPPKWNRLKPQLPKTCADVPILRGRWKKDFSQFIPYDCIIPKYKLNEVLEVDDVKNPKFMDLNNLPYRYTWIRFIGDSNTRALFNRLKQRGACIWFSDGQNSDHKTQSICKLDYKRTRFFGDKDPRPREVYFTYDWFYPGSLYSFETLLNYTFEQTCELFKQKGPCHDLETNTTKKNIRADYTFVSFGSHTPEWSDKQNEEYFDRIFQHVRENYREKLTFITTNAVNIGKIPDRFNGQYTIRNNYRIMEANEILKKHVDKSQEDGYKNIDLLDFFGTTQPVWEFSGDAVHYEHQVYNQQSLLIGDKLADYLRTKRTNNCYNNC